MHTSSCPQCGSPLDGKLTACSSCGTAFSLHQQSWLNLQKDFHLFRQEIQDRILHWEKELEGFRRELFADPSPLAPAISLTPPGELPPVEKAEVPSLRETPPVILPVPAAPVAEKPRKEQKAETSPRSLPLTETSQAVLEEQGWVPFPRLFEYIGRTYRHYKEERKLPVFFMTLGGIVALLFGFGYLMQLGVDWMLNAMSPAFFEGLKISSGLFTGFGLIAWGVRLWKKDEPYREFGSALQGLGLAVNYLVLFFLTLSTYFPFFGRFEVGLGLVSLNAALGAWLALRHETRIVAILSLVGGGMAPLYLHQSGNLLFYLGLVFVLCVTAIWLAGKIQWKPLAVVAFWVALGAQHYSLFGQEPTLSSQAGIWVMHAFAYLFFFYALWQKGKPRRKLAPEHILLLVGSLFVWLIHLGMLIGNAGRWHDMGIILLVNAAVWIGLGLSLGRPAFLHIRRLGFLLGGSLTGLGALLLLNPELWSLALGIEGLLLLVCGFWYRLPTIRWEAWVLLTVAAAKSIFGLAELMVYWSDGLWQAEFVQWLAVGMFCPILWFLLRRGKDQLSKSEQALLEFLPSMWVIWGLVVWHFTIGFYTDLYALNLALVPLLFLTWLGLRQDRELLTHLGLVHLLCFPVAYLISAYAVGDTLFMYQTLAGKLGGLELMACLWGLVAWFGHWKKPEASYPALGILREIFFFLIPIVGLPMIARFYEGWLPLAIWGSALATYALGKYRNTAWSVLVFQLLAMLAFFLSWKETWTLSFVGGAGVLATVLLGEQAFDSAAAKASPYKAVFKASVYYLAFLIGLVLVNAAGLEILALAGSFVSAYFFVLAYKGAKPQWLGKQKKIAYVWGVLCWMLSLGVWGLLITNQSALEGGGYNWLAFFVLWAVLIKYLQHLLQQPKATNKWKAESYLSQFGLLFMGGLSLVFWGWQINGVGMTAFLLLQGIYLLFLASQRKYEHLSKLGFTLLILAFAKLILVDFQQASLLTRILISLFSGGTLLLASRLFLKYRARWEEANENLPLENPSG
ncbi:MAG: DUF2339 domain-containing protein [Bacteroidota bacterium]